MKPHPRIAAVLLIAALVLLSFAGCKPAILDPKNPVRITIWHYYNGSQLVAFDNMVAEFNQTAGKETGIYVESVTQGGVSDLATMVLDTAKGAMGAGSLPDIFCAYPDSAYDVMVMDKVVDLSDYMTQQEILEYLPSFWEEGIIDGVPVIFPIAKSTEVLFIDGNAWDEFAAATGEKGTIEECFSTMERVVATSQAFYEYTDRLTPDVQQDGRALFGIDSMANFFLVAMEQMGLSFMVNQDGEGRINYDEQALRRIWDVYYTPMVRGYFCSINRYRSDDMKTGSLSSFIGSSTGSSYFPDVITFEDGTQKQARLVALPVPIMEGGKKVTVQQGGGMVVTKSEEKREYASVEFLKWLTDSQRNLAFSVGSSYLPVKTQALEGQPMRDTLASMRQSGELMQEMTADVFEVTLSQMKEYRLYYSPTFPGRLDVRYALDALQPRAAQARQTAELALEEGRDYEAAIQALTNDAAFRAWLAELRDEVDGILAEY